MTFDTAMQVSARSRSSAEGADINARRLGLRHARGKSKISTYLPARWLDRRVIEEPIDSS